MKNAIKILMGVSCLAFTAACNVQKTKEGEMPDVNVTTTGGQLPEYNVQTPEVTVGTENKTVEVPTVEVTPANKN
ncbi:hypothetical protein [Sphingomonas sp.]|uniref:hypothetical protein n=1 Tax=Sphingomonas sp. TaxID=28214 RepID=UPI00286CA586|nr:hypothetical protein [Sphingomonas sp.]